jgi:ABC-type glycerol-3-phosphate transport system substrate-binding protein
LELYIHSILLIHSEVEKMSKNLVLSRRKFLQGTAMTAAGGLLAACAPKATPTAAPEKAESTTAAATEAPKPTATAAPVEPVELRYLSPDRELENKVNQMNIDGFNAEMKNQGKPFTMKLELGAATDNDYRTKMTVDAAAGTLADVMSVYSADIAD